MKYYKSNGNYVDDKVVAEIRADAIDEFSEEIEYSFKLNGGIVIEDIERLAEQLKEQKNG